MGGFQQRPHWPSSLVLETELQTCVIKSAEVPPACCIYKCVFVVSAGQSPVQWLTDGQSGLREVNSLIVPEFLAEMFLVLQVEILGPGVKSLRKGEKVEYT
jgi:hypothetical protein